MATLAGRLADFTTDHEPGPGAAVQLLCQDHNGTYVLPFPCHRAKDNWLNTRTGESLEVDVVGWRKWEA